MKKPLLLLVIGGFLVVFGIGLSVYGSQLIIENLATQDQRLGIGMSMEITKDLDLSTNENGVYVIQITDFKNEDRVDATVFDPSGQILTSKTIEHSPLQDNFEILTSGTFKLLVENLSEREIDVTAVIGNLPQDESLTISIFGFIVIIIGLVGLVVGIIYFIKSRGKTDVN
ncbi:MAG TPA: hypothetical protein VLB45_01545 [Nitrosopumilaceae archaeon]|nr:hypothetical protein [Nitrosopumilaceae archaeon]